jgi:uncharacterized membrane protein
MGLHPFRLKGKINPGVGGVLVKFDSRDVTSAAVFAALYVVINVVESFVVGSPVFTYGPVQLRLADALLALAVLFGWPVVGGVTLGCFVTNAYFFLGAPDLVFGPLANFVAAYLIMVLRKRRLLACVAGSLPIGLIVGGYLWLFFPPPEIFGALPAWAGMIVSITVSSLVAIAVVGYLLLSALSRPSILEPLRSRGLKVLPEK